MGRDTVIFDLIRKELERQRQTLLGYRMNPNVEAEMLDAILNELESAGLVERYAIGGAMAGFFYAEAVVTEDLDAFVLLKTSGGLVSLARFMIF